MVPVCMSVCVCACTWLKKKIHFYKHVFCTFVAPTCAYLCTSNGIFTQVTCVCVWWGRVYIRGGRWGLEIRPRGAGCGSVSFRNGSFYEDPGFLETVYFINTIYKKIQREQRTSVHKIRFTQTAGHSVELFTRVVAAELIASDGERSDIYACFNR